MHECFVWLRPDCRGMQRVHVRVVPAMPVWLVLRTKIKRSVSSLYHPCCRPGLWIVWVSMISGTCPHRSHSSLEHAWILTNDEIRCGQSRPGPWILWLAMVGGTYPHRLRLDPWISWISMGGGTYPHRRHLDLWISWILNGRTYPHRYHF